MVCSALAHAGQIAWGLIAAADRAGLHLFYASYPLTPQELADAQTAVKMADTTVKNKQDDLEQTQSLYGKGFVTGAAVKTDELDPQAEARRRVALAQIRQYPGRMLQA